VLNAVIKLGGLQMDSLEIRDATHDNLEPLLSLCIPPENRKDPLFIRGMKEKRKWATQALERYGSIAKLAYLNSKLAGIMQYQPRPEEKVIEISCTFVPEKANLRKGIGKSLLNALIEDAKKPQRAFDNDIPRALVTWAFQVPGRYSQSEFYRRIGFKKVKEDDAFLLYYPIEEGYVYRPREEKFMPQKEDSGKALIFYDPSCPFCISFSERIKDSIRQVAPDISVRMINKFEQQEEVKKRGQVPSCEVNGVAMQSFFMDKESFQKEVKAALEH